MGSLEQSIEELKNAMEGKMRLELETVEQRVDRRLDKTDQILEMLVKGQEKLFKKMDRTGPDIRSPEDTEQEESEGVWGRRSKEGVIKKDGIDLDIQEDGLEAFFKGFGAEIHPIVMLQKAVQNGVIHSYKSQSTPEMYGKWRRNMCEWCDESFGEIGYSGHECKEMGHGNCIFIFNKGREDELLALVKPRYKPPLYLNSVNFSIPKTKEPSNQPLSENCTSHLNHSNLTTETPSKLATKGIEDAMCANSGGNKKIEDHICEDYGVKEVLEGEIVLRLKEEIKEMGEEQIIVHEENMEDQEYLNVEEKEDIKVGMMDNNQSQKNRGRDRKKSMRNKMNLGKSKIKKKKGKIRQEKDRKRKVKKKKAGNRKGQKRKWQDEFHEWKSFGLTGKLSRVVDGVSTAILNEAGGTRTKFDVSFNFLWGFGFMEREKIGGEVKMFEEATEKSGGFAGIGKRAESIGSYGRVVVNCRRGTGVRKKNGDGRNKRLTGRNVRLTGDKGETEKGGLTCTGRTANKVGKSRWFTNKRKEERGADTFGVSKRVHGQFELKTTGNRWFLAGEVWGLTDDVRTAEMTENYWRVTVNLQLGVSAVWEELERKAEVFKGSKMEGEKWERKQVVKIQTGKLKGKLRFLADDIMADIIITDQKLVYFALLQLIVRLTQVLSPRNWKTFYPNPNVFPPLLLSPLTSSTVLFDHGTFKLFDHGTFKQELHQMLELELNTIMMYGSYSRTTNWTHKANFYPP